MDFREADRRYADLKQQYDNGDINAEEFRARHEQITVRDASGRAWAKHRDTGEWHYYDGTTCVRGAPPGDEDAVTEPTTGGPPTQIPPPRDPGAIEDGEKRRRTLPWVLAVGVVSLIAIAVYLLVGNANDAETAALPNVVGKARDDAQKILSTEGFEARVQTRESSQEDEGTVLEQSPPAGSEAERGSEVALFVGAAPPPEETPPPEEALPPEAASGPAPGYIPVEDPTGSLSMETPAAWDPITGLDSEEGLSWTSSRARASKPRSPLRPTTMPGPSGRRGPTRWRRGRWHRSTRTKSSSPSAPT